MESCPKSGWGCLQFVVKSFLALVAFLGHHYWNQSTYQFASMWGSVIHRWKVQQSFG